ncbi:DUF4231 domain-containing protein [Streptomyces flavovirens]
MVGSVSLESVYRYREQWKNHRSTEQLLGHERIGFQTEVGPYAGPTESEFFTVSAAGWKACSRREFRSGRPGMPRRLMGASPGIAGADAATTRRRSGVGKRRRQGPLGVSTR